ncbi:MAG TPA: response regulator [Candidatus Acidoferrales bacterium]|nr:response regulator [Candidatus Acidoferrales bacterium]
MKRHILVVEDNAANLELVTDWLESENFEVSSATNLEQGYAALKGELPHAVLLDVQLGSEDGMSLAAWIRKEPRLRDLPVIAVTAHAMITDRERVMQAGCNACVSKPIDFGLLKTQLDRWLGVAANLPPRT